MSGQAPDYVAPVLGWRAWVVDASGAEARLMSLTRPTAWPVGAPLRAECPVASIVRREPPHPRCGVQYGFPCGIHAARSADAAAFYINLPSRAHDIVVIGRLALWGRVIEGERGWRTSCAYPEHLYLPCRQRSHLGRVEEAALDLTAYGIPIEILECPYLGVVDALACATPLAAGPLPVPVAG